MFLYVQNVLYAQPDKFIVIEDVTDDWFPEWIHNRVYMKNKELSELTDEELLDEAKKIKSNACVISKKGTHLEKESLEIVS